MIAYVLEQGRPDDTLERAHITITWRSKDKRDRDIDNLLSAMKGSIDGLIHAGVIVDDSAKHLSYTLYYEWGDGIDENETILDIEEV
jgi:Holliday junction resolvase RusA-like endonuclease